MSAAVIADISVSLDGFVTGPDPDLEHGLGIGGEPIHTWALDPDEVDEVAIDEGMAAGAVIQGRKLFDIIDGPKGWNDEMGYGAARAGQPQIVVVTHQAPENPRLTKGFHFETGGIEAAVERARSLAGDKPVVIMGGAEVIRSALAANLVHVLKLHLAPVLLGSGTPLFTADSPRPQLVQSKVLVSSHATHLTYTVAG